MQLGELQPEPRVELATDAQKALALLLEGNTMAAIDLIERSEDAARLSLYHLVQLDLHRTKCS